MKNLEEKTERTEILEGEKGYEDCIGPAYLKFKDDKVVWYKVKYENITTSSDNYLNI